MNKFLNNFDKIKFFFNGKECSIFIGFDLFKIKNFFEKFKEKDQVVIITNQRLYDLYYQEIRESILTITNRVDKIIVSDGEKNKSLKTVIYVLNFLKKRRYSKNIVLVALGGGLVGDLTGFVSSIYLRGTYFVQIPTSLLAQIDSSIGGKNAINYKDAKNMVGSFYHPNLILINLSFLNTVSDRQFQSGMTEAIKYGIAMDYSFFCWLENNYKKILFREKETIKHLVYYCCKMKSEIVSQDPEENQNKRVLLNLGHTFAHAIESKLNFSDVLYHGETVSIGIVTSLKVANLINKFSKKNTNRIISLLKKFSLPLFLSKEMSYEDYLFFIQYDKKRIRKNQIDLVLPVEIGKSSLYRNVDRNIVIRAINSKIKNF
ncbi:hypothetical protein AOE57_02375 [Candidatus Riesia pediculicola]|nr:hypothetical protein AOE57_02375 [Candidatus Riesia pediculicola]